MTLGQDPSDLLRELRARLKSSPPDIVTSNVVALLLSRVFEASPHTNLAAVVDLLVDVFAAGSVDSVVAGTVIAPGSPL